MAYSVGAKAIATSNFQVAITSRPCNLTVDAASASRDFLIEIILVAMKTGAKSIKPGRVPIDITANFPSR